MKITITHFEGTPEEYAKAQPLLNGSGGRSEPSGLAPSSSGQTAGGANGELSAAVIERALTRRKPSKNQRKLLDTLLNAGDAGILASAIATNIGISRAQLAGVLGATGRRLANTPGWPENFSLTSSEYDADKMQWRYWLQPLVREVLSSGRVKL